MMHVNNLYGGINSSVWFEKVPSSYNTVKSAAKEMEGGCKPPLLRWTGPT